MRPIRNIAIILLLALIVAEAPGGGDFARGLVAAITIGFLVAIGMIGYQLWRQNRLAYLTLDERSRTVFVVSLGALALMIAAADELFETGLGILAWLAVVGLSVFAVVRVYQESRSL